MKRLMIENLSECYNLGYSFKEFYIMEKTVLKAKEQLRDFELEFDFHNGYCKLQFVSVTMDKITEGKNVRSIINLNYKFIHIPF